MTPKERAIAALELKKPDDIVPTFELEFQLTEELLGRRYLSLEDLESSRGIEKERLLVERAVTSVETARKLDYSIIRVRFFPTIGDEMRCIRRIKKLIGGEYLIAAEADGTFRIPEGNKMSEFIYWLHDYEDEAKCEAEKRVNEAIERGKKLIDAGVEVITMCADYCFNAGPFMSPDMFSKFITPYLEKQIRALKKEGAYTIKHTDGNIMPILNQLVSCQPHALHSLDPMAGVDIAKVKELVGDRICLIGNVNCALLQTGTNREIAESAKYCIEHAALEGGYIFSTSNSVFKGIPLDNYLLILDVRKKYGRY